MAGSFATAGYSRIVLVFLAGNVGNVLEWYDFSVFGFLAGPIGRAFFPSGDKSGQLLDTFAVFGGAFVARPLGGVLIGHVGDKAGRTLALQISLGVMLACTTLMGLLPTYATIGPWAPVLLTILRLVQGLSVGGQLVGAMLFTIENSPPDMRATMGGLCMGTANLGSCLGSLVGAGLRTWLSEDELNDWGWRIPYLTSLPFGLLALCLQRHTDDSEEFVQGHGQDESKASPLSIVFAKHKMDLVRVGGGVMLWPAASYFLCLWLPTYYTELIDEPMENPALGFLVTSAFIGTLVLTLPLAGRLADRWSKRGVMLVGAAGIAVLIVPCMLAVSTGDPAPTFIAQGFLILVWLSLFGGPMAAWMSDSFELSIRFTAVGVAYNVVQAVLGGSSALLATYLAGYGSVPPGAFVAGVGVLAFLCIWIGPEPVSATAYLVPPFRMRLVQSAPALGRGVQVRDVRGVASMPDFRSAPRDVPPTRPTQYHALEEEGM